MISLAQIGVIASEGVAYDPLALAYIQAVEATGVTLTTTQKNAINTYTVTIRANGTLSKRKLILPFIGGTANAHAIDLITATSKVTWNGTVTHNSSGITGNGTTGYGNIAFNPSTDLSSTNAGVGVYIRTAAQGTIVDAGCAQSGSPFNGLFIASGFAGGTGGSAFIFTKIGSDASRIQVDGDFGPYNGYNCGNRTSSTSLKYIRNGITIATSVVSNSASFPSLNQYVCALNNGGTPFGYSNRNYSMLQLWEGMTEAEVIADNADVEALQDALNRGVQ